MKLNEIKTVNKGTYDLTEGVIPVHITMTLEQVIREGKVTNNVQHFVMAGLISMFKDGGPARWPRDLNSYSTMTFGTNAHVLEELKSLPAEDATELAQWLLVQLGRTATFESNPYSASNKMSTVEWVKWVLHHQK
jgi:hypothetical protein